MVRRVPFVPGHYYHLYNHAIGDDNLFREPDNYRYFMDRYAAYVPPIANTYAYCLMPNHFHLLVRIRSEEKVRQYFEQQKRRSNRKHTSQKNLSNQIGQQLGNWLNAYAKAFNKRYHRRGRLFFDSIQRKLVLNDVYRRTLVHYIHWNPVHHGFVKLPEYWLYSSLQHIPNSAFAFLDLDALYSWFDGYACFVQEHFKRQNFKIIAPFPTPDHRSSLRKKK